MLRSCHAQIRCLVYRINMLSCRHQPIFLSLSLQLELLQPPLLLLSQQLQLPQLLQSRICLLLFLTLRLSNHLRTSLTNFKITHKLNEPDKLQVPLLLMPFPKHIKDLHLIQLKSVSAIRLLLAQSFLDQGRDISHQLVLIFRFDVGIVLQ